jgi:hypothetical protein
MLSALHPSRQIAADKDNRVMNLILGILYD